MATISPSWTENVSLRTTATLAAGATANVEVDLDNLGADRSDVQILIDIGSSSGVTVKVFNSADGGTTYDTSPLMSYTVAADDTRTLTLTGAYRRVAVINDDGSNAVTDVVIDHSWRQWTSV